MTADQAPYAPLQIAEAEFLRIGAPVGAAQWAIRALARAGWLTPPDRVAALEAVEKAARTFRDRVGRGMSAALDAALDAASAGTTTKGLRDVRVSEIRPGVEWLLDGAWVLVVDTTVGHPDDRVTVTYEQDGERDTTREYHGYERAAVRDAAPAGTTAEGENGAAECECDHVGPGLCFVHSPAATGEDKGPGLPRFCP